MQEWGGAAARKRGSQDERRCSGAINRDRDQRVDSRHQLIISRGSQGKYCMFQILVVIYLAGISLSYLPVLEQSALAL